jgi:hypothetical protein
VVRNACGVLGGRGVFMPGGIFAGLKTDVDRFA